MLCPNCGADLGERQIKFCPNCGKGIPAAVPQPKVDNAEPVSLWDDLQFEKVVRKTGDSVLYRAINKQTNSYAMVKVITVPSKWEDCEKLLSTGMSADDLKKHFAKIANSWFVRCQRMQNGTGSEHVVNVHDVQIAKKDQIRWEIQARTEMLTPFCAINFGDTVKVGAIAKLAADLCDGISALRAANMGVNGISLDDIYMDRQGNYKLGVFADAQSGVAGQELFQAPEVQSNGYADAKSDVYTVGLVMYYLLNNRQMPQGDMMSPPPNAPVQLARVIACACAQNPNGRYTSAEQLKSAIVDALRPPKPQVNNEKPPVKTESAKKQEPKRTPKGGNKRLTTVILALVLVLALGAGAFFGIRWLRESDVELPAFIEKIIGKDSSIDDEWVDDENSHEKFDEKGDPDQDYAESSTEPEKVPEMETEPAVLMPNVAGMKYNAAAEELSTLGCIVTFEYDFSDTVEKDYVISQSVSENTALETGTNIVLVVSQGSSNAPEGYNQKVVVTAGSGSSYGTLVFYEWEEGQWISKFSCDATVGKNGISSNYGEGKGRTPEGSYKLGIALSANSIPNSGWPFQQVSSNTCVVDDVNSIYYNTIQNKNNVPSGTSVDPIGNTIVKGYSTVCVYIEHNGNGLDSEGVVAGKGSVITLCGRTGSLKPTAGCVDISSSNMTTLLGMLDYSKNPHIEMYVQ